MNPIIAADAQYALELCARIAAITDVPGTITRLFLSPATHQVHALLREEMESLGMTVRLDSIGNLRGLYPTQIPQAPVLLVGSHIDTVPDAGPYDGILGIAAPLALLRALKGRRLPYAIEVIAFSEEEGIRFKQPFLGSRALTGNLSCTELARKDSEGISIAQAIRNFGLNPDSLADCAPTPNTFAFLELHIEQGPVLESLDLPIGIVSTIVGQSRFDFTFHGQANHAGTTPMNLRRDALVAAAEFICSVERYAGNHPSLIATVGTIHAKPGASNIIPGTVTLSLDIRHSENTTRVLAAESLRALAELAGAHRNVHLTAHLTSQHFSVAMDPTLRNMLADAAQAAGYAAHVMPSGAGHDAMIATQRIEPGPLPAAMLFLRTPGGLSHHPDESVSAADVQAALETCFHFVEQLDVAAFNPDPSGELQP